MDRMKKSLILVAVTIAFGVAHAEDLQLNLDYAKPKAKEQDKTRVQEASREEARKALLTNIDVASPTDHAGPTQAEINGTAAVQSDNSFESFLNTAGISVRATLAPQAQKQAAAKPTAATQDGPMCSKSQSDELAGNQNAGNICKEFEGQLREDIIAVANFFNQQLGGVPGKSVSREKFLAASTATIDFMVSKFGWSKADATVKFIALAKVMARDNNDLPLDTRANCVLNNDNNQIIADNQETLLCSAGLGSNCTQ